jgi:hypothetical protein
MEQEEFKRASPLIQKIICQKFPKLNSESLKNIVDRARHMTKLTQPSGCSQNLKAEFQDPEKALEYSRRKNMIFENYLKTELSQLNCSKSPVKPSNRSRRRFMKSFDHSPKLKSLTTDPKPSKVSKPKSKFNTPLDTYNDTSYNDFLSKSLNPGSSLPPLIKSTPLYLDPRYSFIKKNSLEDQVRLDSLKNQRMTSLDSVDQKCSDFIPDCKFDIQELKQVQNLKQASAQRIQEYMEDFSDCLKISKDQKTFEDSMSTKQYNRKLNSGFKEELESLRSNLLEVTKRAIDLGGKKIWRWKNTLFLANADKLINSVPLMRK